MSDTSAAMFPVGAVLSFAGNTAPDGWLMCNGQTVSRAVYADLFAVIGTAFGAGDEVSTFAIPNMSARRVIGVTVGDFRGLTAGSTTRTLTEDNLPAHTHSGTTDVGGAHSHTTRLGTVDNQDFTSQFSNHRPPGDSSVKSTSTYTINSTGSEHAHAFTTNVAGSAAPTAVSIMNPYIALNFIIKF